MSFLQLSSQVERLPNEMKDNRLSRLTKWAPFLWARLRRFRASIFILREFLHDWSRYFRYSTSGTTSYTVGQLQGRLLKTAHSIEKGLSLPVIRPAFGVKAFKELIVYMREFQRRELDQRHPSYMMATNAIACYLNYHKSIGIEIPSELQYVSEFAAKRSEHGAGGVLHLTANTVRANARGDFAALTCSRHSVRMFDNAPVAMEKIVAAVRLAQGSPSVCNRQGARVYLIEHEDMRRAALRLQGGNRGFADEIGTLLVIACSLEVFRGGRERYQTWIDGGLFAMSLMYALHYLGLGSCPLNWSADNEQDCALRRLLNLPESNTVIMLLAVGELRDEFTVASSPRLSVDEIFRVIEPGGVFKAASSL